MLMLCPVCKRQVSVNANACPGCGENFRWVSQNPVNQSVRFLITLFWIAVVIGGLVVLANAVWGLMSLSLPI